MAKFKVIYKYSRKVDLGEIEAKNIKEVEKKADYILNHNILLRSFEDGIPYFSIKKINNRKEKRNEKK